MPYIWLIGIIAFAFNDQVVGALIWSLVVFNLIVVIETLLLWFDFSINNALVYEYLTFEHTGIKR